MKEIKLRKSDRVALVDDEDYEFLSRFRWYCTHEKNCYYAVSFSRIDGYPVPLRMHRLLLRASVGMMVDHIDCNGLNNQRSNLRLATHAQNSRNRRPNKGRQYKGVRKTRNNTYEAVISHNGRRIYLGTFNNSHDAATAYNNAAVKYFGRFAKINLIERLPIYYKLMALSK